MQSQLDPTKPLGCGRERTLVDGKRHRCCKELGHESKVNFDKGPRVLVRLRVVSVTSPALTHALLPLARGLCVRVSAGASRAQFQELRRCLARHSGSRVGRRG